MGAIDSAAGPSRHEPGRHEPGRDELGLLRSQLTNLRALLVLSILMTESADDQQILRLASSAAASLGSWQIAGFVIGDAWRTGGGRCGALAPELAGELRTLPETGGPVTTLGATWAWAYPLRSISGPLGYLVVHAAREPALEEQFLAQVLAQQAGVAVSNAQLHGRERDTAVQLAATNEALEETVATLRRGMAIHERLTRVAAAGEGAAGLAEALHDLTGLAVAVELPLVVCDIQRAGPSTGMPTKTEQADLLMALYGRNGESPLVVIAPSTPGDCFTTAIEATRQYLQNEPEDILGYTNLSMFYQQKGMIKEAEAAGAEARRLDWKRQLKEGKK